MEAGDGDGGTCAAACTPAFLSGTTSLSPCPFLILLFPYTPGRNVQPSRIISSKQKTSSCLPLAAPHLPQIFSGRRRPAARGEIPCRNTPVPASRTLFFPPADAAENKDASPGRKNMPPAFHGRCTWADTGKRFRAPSGKETAIRLPPQAARALSAAPPSPYRYLSRLPSISARTCMQHSLRSSDMAAKSLFSITA